MLPLKNFTPDMIFLEVWETNIKNCPPSLNGGTYRRMSALTQLLNAARQAAVQHLQRRPPLQNHSRSSTQFRAAGGGGCAAAERHSAVR